mgnify:CR=1 FL=1
MIFDQTLASAQALDSQDSLAAFRSRFLIPQHDGQDIRYFCGNSLGLQPKSAQTLLQEQLKNWQNLAVEGWFEGESPWMTYHQELQELLAPIVGANPAEVVPMNNLTVNLHLMMVSFYLPKGKKIKILMEGGAFPSDQYAVESHLRFHGIDPNEAILEVFPREGEETLRTEDILAQIEANADELALILFGGINYYTGQLFDMAAITKAGHAVGAKVGFDLAHAAGNVPLKLHDWGVDFAAWCGYKYLNSSPGGVAGMFVHEKHAYNKDLKRFAGWWGHNKEERFKMESIFDPIPGAEGWQLSNAPVLGMAVHLASLELFEAAGMKAIGEKRDQMTAYLRFIIEKISELNVETLRLEKLYLTGEASHADKFRYAEILVNDDLVEQTITTITDAVKTGKIGDGKIFITEVSEIVRIRTGERGAEALS